MTYDFFQIVQSDGSVLEGEKMTKLLAAATQGWSQDMRRRGYAPISEGQAVNGGATPRGDVPQSVVLRSAGRMKADLEEEEAMKAAMLARAQAKS
jgi:hypothetical protein